MFIALSLIVCVVGLVLYHACATHPKWATTGLVMFGAGLLVCLLQFGARYGNASLVLR